MVVVKSHPDRRTHHLLLWTTTAIVTATSSAASAAAAAAAAVRSRCGLRVRSPLRGGSRVRLAVGRLGSGLVLGLATIRRLLLIDLGGIVGVVVLGRQRGVRRALWRVLLAMFGVPLGRLLRRLGIAWLGGRSGVGRRGLRAVCRLLAVGVARMVRLMRLMLLVRLVLLVVAATIVATPTSAAVTATRRTVRGRGIPGRSACRCRRRGRRRRTVVV